MKVYNSQIATVSHFRLVLDSGVLIFILWFIMMLLQVELLIKSDEDTSVKVTCHWCITLGIVTCHVDLNVSGDTGDLVSRDTILSHITRDRDSGHVSPNPANTWQLSQLGLQDSLEKHLPGQLFYFWAQRLAGLDFLEATKTAVNDSNPLVEAKPEVSKLYMENIIDSIRTRLVTRKSLHKQIENLSKLKIDVAAAASGGKMPSRSMSKLKSWQSIDWETYNQFEFSKHLVSTDLVHSDCFLYKATITRDKGDNDNIIFYYTACVNPFDFFF